MPGPIRSQPPELQSSSQRDSSSAPELAPNKNADIILKHGEEIKNAKSQFPPDKKVRHLTKQTFWQSILNIFHVKDKSVSNLSLNTVRSLNTDEILELAKRQGGTLPPKYLFALTREQIDKLPIEHMNPENVHLLGLMLRKLPDTLGTLTPLEQAAILAGQPKPMSEAFFASLDSLDLPESRNYMLEEHYQDQVYALLSNCNDAVFNLAKSHFLNVEFPSRKTDDSREGMINTIPIGRLQNLRVELRNTSDEEWRNIDFLHLRYLGKIEIKYLVDSKKIQFIDVELFKQLSKSHLNEIFEDIDINKLPEPLQNVLQAKRNEP